MLTISKCPSKYKISNNFYDWEALYFYQHTCYYTVNITFYEHHGNSDEIIYAAQVTTVTE